MFNARLSPSRLAPPPNPLFNSESESPRDYASHLVDVFEGDEIRRLSANDLRDNAILKSGPDRLFARLLDHDEYFRQAFRRTTVGISGRTLQFPQPDNLSAFGYISENTRHLKRASGTKGNYPDFPGMILVAACGISADNGYVDLNRREHDQRVILDKVIPRRMRADSGMRFPGHRTCGHCFAARYQAPLLPDTQTTRLYHPVFPTKHIIRNYQEMYANQIMFGRPNGPCWCCLFADISMPDALDGFQVTSKTEMFWMTPVEYACMLYLYNCVDDAQLPDYSYSRSQQDAGPYGIRQARAIPEVSLTTMERIDAAVREATIYPSHFFDGNLQKWEDFYPGLLASYCTHPYVIRTTVREARSYAQNLPAAKANGYDIMNASPELVGSFLFDQGEDYLGEMFTLSLDLAQRDSNRADLHPLRDFWVPFIFSNFP